MTRIKLLIALGIIAAICVLACTFSVCQMWMFPRAVEVNYIDISAEIKLFEDVFAKVHAERENWDNIIKIMEEQ